LSGAASGSSTGIKFVTNVIIIIRRLASISPTQA
jgi:hypothetical protein